MIKDSGNRTEFESGAVRDIQEGKGRCDLLPLEMVDELLNGDYKRDKKDTVLKCLDRFQKDGDYKHLLEAVYVFVVNEKQFADLPTAILEYSIHMEEGCNKYGDRNWEMGIPCRNYVNSATRHYLKHIRGDIIAPFYGTVSVVPPLQREILPLTNIHILSKKENKNFCQIE